MKSVILLICYCLLAVVAAMGQNIWRGTINNKWEESGNWSLGHVPTETEDVMIPASYINHPVILGGDTYVGTLDISGKLYLLNGTYLWIRKNLTTHSGTEFNTTNRISSGTEYPPFISLGNGLYAGNNKLTSSLQNATIWGDMSILIEDGTLNEGNNIYKGYVDNSGRKKSSILFRCRAHTAAASLLLGNAGASRYEGDLYIDFDASVVSDCSIKNFSVGGNFYLTSGASRKLEIIGAPNNTTVAGTIDINITRGWSNSIAPIITIANFSNGAATALRNIIIDSAAYLAFTGNKLNIHKANIKGLIGSGGINFTQNTLNIDTFNIVDNSANTGNWMLQSNTFKGDFNFTKNGSGRAYLYGNAFNGPLAFTQNGNGDCTTSGNRVDGSAAIKMLGNGRLSNPGDFDPNIYGPDQFAGDLTLTTSNTGRISLNGPAIGGNLKLYGNNTTVNNIVFNGNGDSHLYSDHAPITFSELTIAKTSETGKLILDVPVNMFSTGGFLIPLAKVNFTRGTVLSSKTAPFTFQGRNIVIPVGSDASHVAGPVTKIGEPYIDNTTSFTFPIGSGTKYYPLTVSGTQISPTDQFTAEYISQNPTAAGYDVTKMAATLKGVSTAGYWLLSRDAGTTNVTATFTFNAAPGTITSLSKLRVAHWNGSLWEDLGNGGATWIDSARGIGHIITAAPVTSFSPFAIATIDAAANVLPVTFTTLSAIYKNGNIEINWATASETNCSHYDIEVSADGKNFTKMGTVASKAVNGSSQTELDYSFSFAPSATALSALVLLPFLLAFVNRKRVVAFFGVAILTSLLISLAACKKQKEAIATGASHLYIRIAQVDKDGGVHYSKVTGVAEEQ